ncbi:MAG: hypothetical protein E7074_07435 [Bacteroidales bacterium]|nr:hypothetical protein [Bacteroidales bacterium]
MRRRFVTLLALSLATLFAVAAPVSESEAMGQAQAFLAGRGKGFSSLTMAPARRGMETESTAPYYAFNVENDGGFVVVSGDDNLDPILGYADQGGIDLNNLPDGLQYMLDCYAAASPARTPVIVHRTVRAPIAPLIQTKWDQYEPYNLFTPLHSDTTPNTPTGCVATAMAQVMKYWNWPHAACQPLPGYRPPFNPNDTVGPVPATTFDWANMLPTYTGGESETQKNAVAKLMEYCGKATQMHYDFSYGETSSIGISYAFKTYFDYDPGVQYVYREHYSYAQWVSLLYNELAEGRPVCYSSEAAGGGHAFVCDGYDTDDYFHFNWGWSGTSDGYFRLVDPNPYDQGAGGSSTDDGFSMSERVTIGIQPSTKPTGKNYGLILEEIDLEMYEGHQLTYFLVRSYTPGTNSFDLNLRLYNPDGTLYSDLWTREAYVTIQYLQGKYLYYHFYDDSIADGTYQVKLFSRMTGETEWLECMDWEAQPITLTVTNGHDTTTTTHPANFIPVDATFSVEGNQQVGSRLTVTAHVTGGDADYSGDLILYVNGWEAMGFQVDIPAHGTRDVVFTYVPTAAGNDTLALGTGWEPVGRDTVITIQSAGEISGQVALNANIAIHNTEGNSLYGGRLQATFTCSNPSVDTTYYGYIWLYLWEYLPGGTAWNRYSLNCYRRVPSADSLVIDIDEAGLEAGAWYYLSTYIYRETTDGYVWDVTASDYYCMNAGYEVYDAEGRSTLHLLSDTLNVGDATFVDFSLLTEADTVSCFIPSSNPNCVYVLNDTVTLPWAAGLQNVIRDGHADSITLTDGYAFYTPIEFTATSIRYKRPYRMGASTIYLPFDVPQVPGGLLSFEYEVPGDVVFTGVYYSLEANTPYLFIGDRQSAADSVLLFTGENATIAPSKVASRCGNHYKFSGSTYVMALEDVYVEGEGSGFSHQDFAVSQPFRAWFRDSEIAPYPVEMLDIRLLPTDVEIVEGHESKVKGRGEKFLRDGVLYILYDGLLYDALGRKISVERPLR